MDKTTELFREKILRKCGESVEMKQEFFSTYAEQIEAMCREMAERFSNGKKLLVAGMAAVYVMRCISAWNSRTQSSKSGEGFL